MAGKPRYKESTILAAIEESRGIVSLVAQRLQCRWETANKYCKGDLSTIRTREAFRGESEAILDIAESVLATNISIARRAQTTDEEGRLLPPEKRRIVDTSDAKWLLSRKGASRGYSERTEITGADGKDLPPLVVIAKKGAG